MKTIAISTLGLLLAPLAHAQIASLNCTSLGGSTLSAPAYYASINTNAPSLGSLFYAFVYTDFTQYANLLNAEKAGTSYTCTLTNPASTVSFSGAVVNSTDLSATEAIGSTPAEVYASADFFFTSVTSGGVTLTTTATATAEEKSRALAAAKTQAMTQFLSQKAAAR